MLEKPGIDEMEEEMMELRRESLRAKLKPFKAPPSQLQEKEEEEASMALIRQLQEEQEAKARAEGNKEEQESLAYIKRMQEAEEEQAKRAARLAEEQARQLAKELEEKQIKEKVEDSEPEMCRICLCEIEEGCFPLEGCEHFFHQECLKQHLDVNLNEGNFPIKCPDDKCGVMVMINDIQELLDEQQMEKFYKFSFNDYVSKHNKEVACCPTADCQFHFFRMPEDDPHFKCPDCNSDYCMDCRAYWHDGMTCKEYQVNVQVGSEDEKFEQFVKGSRFKRCPNCGFWVEKVDGCEYIMCKCGKNFCYICGKSHVEHFCPFKNEIKFKAPRIMAPKIPKIKPRGGGQIDDRNKKRKKLPPVLARFLKKKRGLE